MSRPTAPPCKPRNWPACHEALKRRGSGATIRFDPAMAREAAPAGKPGRQPDDSDAALQTGLTLRVLFGMALRQIEPSARHWSEHPWRGGFVESPARS